MHTRSARLLWPTLLFLLVGGALPSMGCLGPDAEETGVEVEEALEIGLSPEADAHARSGGYAGTNFGRDANVQVDGDDVGTRKEAYLRFRVGDVGTVTRARLRLFVTNASWSSAVVDTATSNTWSETQLTWWNRPARTGTKLATVGQTIGSTWVDIDVTARVKANSVVTFVLVPSSTDGFWASSREATANRPRLVLEASGPTPVSAPDAGTPVVESGYSPLTAGAHYHYWNYANATERLRGLDMLKAANVTWMRLDVGWSTFEEQCRGCYANWYITLIDSVVDAARARGINVLMVVHQTPYWASGTSSVATPPSNPADFGTFMGWLAAHYKGRIPAYEIWNEPDLTRFFTGSPAQYAALLKAAYPKIKAADPAAKVVFGAPTYQNVPFIRDVYAAGAQGSFDVMATHPYQGMADDAPEAPDDGSVWHMTHQPAVDELMKQHGDGAKEVWWTEFGWSTHSNFTGINPWERGVTLAQQGDFVTRALNQAKAKWPRVTKVFLYNDRAKGSDGSAPAVHQAGYGLYHRDFSLKPAYSALKAWNLANPGH